MASSARPPPWTRIRVQSGLAPIAARPATSAQLTGLPSATIRIQCGMSAVAMNAVDRNVSGSSRNVLMPMIVSRCRASMPTVFENALVGAMRAGGMRGRQAYGAAYEALVLTAMTGQANTRSSALRLLDRKRLELARALAMRPTVLLLDEIAGGLSDPETEILIETIRSVNASGTTIVWVEHVIRVLTAVSTRLVCLADGHVLADGRPAEVLASDEVRAAFLGGGVL